MVRGLTQRPGGQARPGEDWRGSSWCPPGEDAPGLHTGPHARPPGPRGGVASEVGPGRRDGFLDGVTGESRAHTHTLTRSCTHTLPGHMGMAGAPDSPTPEGPRQQREATTRPQHSHTHTHTHTCTNLAWAGSHSGGGGPVLGVSTQDHPQSRIPGSIWGAGEPDPPARLAKAREQQRGRLDGQTEGWTEPLVLGKLINRFVRGPLCGLGAKPWGQELVDWRRGSSLPSPGWGPPVQRPALSLGVVQTGAKVGRAGSRNVTISAVSR